MEIKIDKNKLNKNINILEELINKYKENNIDMYKEITKIDSYWYGEEKDNFISKINDIERNNYIILSSYLDKILTIYKDINDNYTKDIYYNNKNRTYLLYNIDSNVNNISKTNRSINNLVIPYNSNNKDRIERINYHLYCIKKELELYQNNLEVTTNRIEKNEIEIIAKINNLQEEILLLFFHIVMVYIKVIPWHIIYRLQAINDQ